jgi:hypothetical protein
MEISENPATLATPFMDMGIHDRRSQNRIIGRQLSPTSKDKPLVNRDAFESFMVGDHLSDDKKFELELEELEITKTEFTLK